MLLLAEEILLLILNNEASDIGSSLLPSSLEMAIAGSVLMDLALENRIDTDFDRLMVVDSSPVGNDVLDPVLADIASEAVSRPVSWWLERISAQAEPIHRRALLGLVEHGILESDGFDMFVLSQSVLRSRRYPALHGQAADEVQVRIMRLLFSNDIPDPRDVSIVALAEACGLFERILSRREFETAKERINLLSRADTIGRSIVHSLRRESACRSSGSPPPERDTADIRVAACRQRL